METKEPFQVDGTTVYQLEHDGWYKGLPNMRNRIYASVQGYRDTPKEELEATARLFAAAPDLLEAVQLLLCAMSLANWEGDDAAIKGRAAVTKALDSPKNPL